MAERPQLQSKKGKVLLGYNYLLKSNKKTKSLNRAINSPENNKMIYSQKLEQRELYKKEYLDELIECIKNPSNISIDSKSKEYEFLNYLKFLHLKYEGNQNVTGILRDYEHKYIEIQNEKLNNCIESKIWPSEFKDLVMNVWEVMKGAIKEGYQLEDSYKFTPGTEGEEIREKEIENERRKFCLVKA